MTIQDLGSIGELLAAIATIATLVYVAVQIRNGIVTSRGNTHHSTATAWSELHFRIASDSDLADLYHKGRITPEQLSAEDRRRFHLLLDSILAQIENIWVQYSNGLFPKSNQDRFDDILRAQFATPGMQGYWPRRRGLLMAEFVDHVENTLKLPPRDPNSISTPPQSDRAQSLMVRESS